MGVTTTIAACICGVLSAASFIQQAGWRGIVPLHSTRSDVERLIGPPMRPGGITYDLRTERVNVGYSHGGCEKGEEWNVASGTVTMITVYPQTKVMLSDLKIDLNRFQKFLDPHIGDSIFANEAEGMSLRTAPNGEVISIQYFPQTKDNHLRCSMRHKAVMRASSMNTPTFHSVTKKRDSITSRSTCRRMSRSSRATSSFTLDNACDPVRRKCAQNAPETI